MSAEISSAGEALREEKAGSTRIRNALVPSGDPDGFSVLFKHSEACPKYVTASDMRDSPILPL
jgi:hypothetical protein